MGQWITVCVSHWGAVVTTLATARLSLVGPISNLGVLFFQCAKLEKCQFVFNPGGDWEVNLLSVGIFMQIYIYTHQRISFVISEYTTLSLTFSAVI